MKIKELRQKMNLSQYEVAEKICIPRTTYSNYEAELHDPSVTMLIKLADFFNVSIDELVERPTDILNLNFLDEKRKGLIKEILSASDNVVDRLEAVFEGMKIAEQERQEIIDRIKNGRK